MRSAVGFLTSFQIVMPLLRAEMTKTELMTNQIMYKYQRLEFKKSLKISDLTLTAKALIQFTFAIGGIFLASLLYKYEKQDTRLFSNVLTCIVFLAFFLFYCAYKCKEPQVKNQSFFSEIKKISFFLKIKKVSKT